MLYQIVVSCSLFVVRFLGKKKSKKSATMNETIPYPSLRFLYSFAKIKSSTPKPIMPTNVYQTLNAFL